MQGAYVWNCKTLISEIKDAKKQLQALLHDDFMYSTKGKLLEHNLDPEVRDALQALKHKLAQVERS
jgi:chaperonin cofactor prefoldin